MGGVAILGFGLGVRTKRVGGFLGGSSGVGLEYSREGWLGRCRGSGGM